MKNSLKAQTVSCPMERGSEGRERKTGFIHLNTSLGQKEENRLSAGEKVQF